MTTLVSLVLNNADRLPIVGSPIGQATTWYRKYSTGGDGPYDNAQPPPYEKVPSRLTKISDYVWKRNSFSSTTSDNEIPVMDAQAHIDKNLVNDGIQLLKIAADMNNGSTKHSLDLYIMGLDKILASLPVESDPTAKEALELKLKEFKLKKQLILDDPNEKSLTDEQKDAALSGLSGLIINASVIAAVALKKSPIPYYMSNAMEVTKAGLVKIDETCSIRKRSWNIASFGVSKAVEMDKHYQVHQFFAEVFYTSCAAMLKAGIAYAETPSVDVPSQ